MHYYITDTTVDYYLPTNKTSIPNFSIEKHYLPTFAMTQLDNPSAIYLALQTTANIFKNIQTQDSSSDQFTYTLTYTVFDNPELHKQSEPIYRNIHNFLQTHAQSPLTIDQIIYLLKADILPQPPRKLQFLRSDGKIFEYSFISKATLSNLKAKEYAGSV